MIGSTPIGSHPISAQSDSVVHAIFSVSALSATVVFIAPVPRVTANTAIVDGSSSIGLHVSRVTANAAIVDNSSSIGLHVPRVTVVATAIDGSISFHTPIPLVPPILPSGTIAIINAIGVIYEPTVVITNNLTTTPVSTSTSSASYLVGAPIVYGLPPAVGVTFIYNRHIYSKVKQKRRDITIEATKCESKKVRSVILESFKKENIVIKLEQFSQTSSSMRIQNGKISILQK